MRVSAAPCGVDRGGKRLRAVELPAAIAAGAHEIRVAEVACGAGAIFLPAAPQVAPGKAAEHRGRAGVRALTLQRVEDFLDGIHRLPPLADP